MRQKPGIKNTVILTPLGVIEAEIINNLATIWFIADAHVYQKGKVSFPYVILKPSDDFKMKFNLQSDILCLFHPYPVLDSRVQEAIDRIMNKHYQRLDRLCTFLVTNADGEIQERGSIADSDPRTVVPFTYRELKGGAAGKERLMIERLEKYLFSKDLFAMSAALKNDRFFFGRTNEIQRLVGNYQNNENSTVFGLRRIGKTSVLWAVVRCLKEMGTAVALIDGNDPKYHRANWNKALYRVKESIYQVNAIKGGHTEVDYSEADATTSFAKDLRLVKNKTLKPILIIFDEIQNLCFDDSSSPDWSLGTQSIPFWQSIRSVYQQNQNLFSFILGGTNAKIIEAPHTNAGLDNPLFDYIKPHYLGFFNWEEVKSMLVHIGSHMGMSFEEPIYHLLNNDFGGHPFLIRQACSKLWELQATPNVPRRIKIGIQFYQSKKHTLFEHTRIYITLILEVLTERYKREYELLRTLAAGNQEKFRIHIESSPSDVTHLIGYGLIEKQDDTYTFRIAAVEAAVKKNARDLVCPEEIEERWALLSRERNQFEYKFRECVRSTLKVTFGKTKAKEEVIGIMNKKHQAEAAFDLEYDQIFAKEFYFSNLKELVIKHWDCFKYIFDEDKQRFKKAMEVGNKFRADAHAKVVNKEEFRTVMPELVWLANCLESNL